MHILAMDALLLALAIGASAIYNNWTTIVLPGGKPSIEAQAMCAKIKSMSELEREICQHK